jgi:transposase
VVIEATFGWYWAVDVLTEMGAKVHLAHPLGNNWGNRRVKNDERDAADLVDLLRLGRLAEAWIAPPELRELREMVRYRHKLCRLRSGLKAQVHAVMGKHGGNAQLDGLDLPEGYSLRLESLRDLIVNYDREIVSLDRRIAIRLADHPGYRAIQAIDGVGPILAAVFVAEIGDVTRFPTADRLCSWAGMTPKHRESDTKVRRGSISKQGSRLLRWAAVEAVQKNHAGGDFKPPTDRSPSGEAATSPKWPPAANFSPSCITACATATSVASLRPQEGDARTQPTVKPVERHDPTAGRHNVIGHCWLRRIAPCSVPAIVIIIGWGSAKT